METLRPLPEKLVFLLSKIPFFTNVLLPINTLYSTGHYTITKESYFIEIFFLIKAVKMILMHSMDNLCFCRVVQRHHYCIADRKIIRALELILAIFLWSD